jgi:hypothetical protein
MSGLFTGLWLHCPTTPPFSFVDECLVVEDHRGAYTTAATAVHCPVVAAAIVAAMCQRMLEFCLHEKGVYVVQCAAGLCANRELVALANVSALDSIVLRGVLPHLSL